MQQIEELLKDIGLGIGPMQRFIELQMPVKPGRYAGVARDLHRCLDRPQGAVVLAELA